MWNHRNEMIFQDSNPNPSSSLVKTHCMCSNTKFYNSRAKLFSLTGSASAVISTKLKKRINTLWNPPLLSWLKWNTDTCKVSHKKFSIEMVCRDSSGHIILSEGNKIRDVQF